jgi:hypothetical protein
MRVTFALTRIPVAAARATLAGSLALVVLPTRA